MLAGLILAAGRATRFGSDKRQAMLPSGQTLLDTVLTRYRQVFDTVLVVIPPDDAFAQDACARHGATPVVAPHPEQGMSHSLAAGMGHLQSHPPAAGEWQGVVVGLADMPEVSVAVLQQVCKALQHSCEQDTPPRPVVPRHQGQLGHPRGIPAHHFPALTRLSGDQGARAALDWSQAVMLDVECPGVLLDIDTPADLARLG